MYKQLLLPYIEYCSAILNSISTSIYKLEMIQHWAAHFVLNKPWLRSPQQENRSVTDMFTYLKWSTLQDRKTIARLTLLFKILHKMITIPDRCLPLPAPISSTQSTVVEQVTAEVRGLRQHRISGSMQGVCGAVPPKAIYRSPNLTRLEYFSQIIVI